MSTILVNTLTGTSTAGSIAVTGEGNSTTTNLQQGLNKAWAFVQGSDGSFKDSFNYGSVTDNGTGDYSYTFTNNMGNGNFSVAAMVNASDNKGVTRGTNSTTGHDINVFNTSNSAVDTASSFITAGDLA